MPPTTFHNALSAPQTWHDHCAPISPYCTPTTTALKYRPMTKTQKIIYWIATVWLCLGMLSSAIVQLLRIPEGVQSVTNLGYPAYLLTILGIWKILGVVTVLVPKFPRLKEWAYAGFFFVTSGAFVSHITMKAPFGEIFPSILLLVLTVVSWYFRPASRKLAGASE